MSSAGRTARAAPGRPSARGAGAGAEGSEGSRRSRHLDGGRGRRHGRGLDRRRFRRRLGGGRGLRCRGHARHVEVRDLGRTSGATAGARVDDRRCGRGHLGGAGRRPRALAPEEKQARAAGDGDPRDDVLGVRRTGEEGGMQAHAGRLRRGLARRCSVRRATPLDASRQVGRSFHAQHPVRRSKSASRRAMMRRMFGPGRASRTNPSKSTSCSPSKPRRCRKYRTRRSPIEQ